MADRLPLQGRSAFEFIRDAINAYFFGGARAFPVTCFRLMYPAPTPAGCSYVLNGGVELAAKTFPQEIWLYRILQGAFWLALQDCLAPRYDRRRYRLLVPSR